MVFHSKTIFFHAYKFCPTRRIASTRTAMPPRKAPTVTLLQRFCPLCFKGRIGHSGGERVPATSKRIDSIQALHSRQGNGLPLLDLQYECQPEDFCENPCLCKVLCLVCGRPVIHGEDDDFQLFLDCCNGDDRNGMAKFELDDALERNEAVWTECWNTPIHEECAWQGRCGCWTPKGAKECKKHRPRSRIPAPTQKSKPISVKARQSEQAVQKPAAYKLEGMTKGVASWLQGTSRSAILTTEMQEQAKPRFNSGIGKRKPEPPKPNKKLLAAASKSRRMDVFLAKTPDSPTTPACEAQTKSARFSLELHMTRFDDRIHGYYRTNKGYFYLFPDGRRVQVVSEVNELLQDGSLKAS